MATSRSVLPWRIIGYAAHLFKEAVAFTILSLVLPRCITSHYANAANILLFMVIVQFVFEFEKKWYFRKKIPPERKAVLITGCDSGFGHALAKRLDTRGFHVFAGCLNPLGDGAADLKRSCSSRLHIVELDVTKEESISSALQYVKNHITNLELWAVVNNAGIQRGFGFMMSNMKDFEDTFQVNTFGLVRVTKAFLPLLCKSKGRVINVTGLSGRFPVPHLCPYTMSKFAAVAFTECLRYEMKDWGVTVIGVEPEMYKTGITDFGNVSQRITESFEELDEDTKALYEKQYLKCYKSAIRNVLSVASDKIERVVDDLESAICLENPDSVYKSTRNIFMATFYYLAERLPRTIVDFLICIGTFIFGFPKPPKASVHKYLLNKKGL